MAGQLLATLRGMLGRGIGRRLLVWILLFSTLVTLMLTAGQLYLEYRRDVGAIEQRMEEIRDAYLHSLSRSLWNVDVDQLRIQLAGIQRLPDMRAAEVREVAAGGAPPLDLRVGARDARHPLVRELPLIHVEHGMEQTIGVLRLEATLDEVYDRMLARAATILVSQGIKTFLVSLFILFIVHRLVTRHLTAFAEAVARYDVRQAASGLHLDRPPGQRDELQRLLEAFDAMRAHLESAYRQLGETNARLEADVAARRAAEAAAAHQALHDPLTGLPNRRLLLERLQQDLAHARRTENLGALLFLDLDNFKDVNDALGHSVGDRLLIEVAHRMQAQFRAEDLVARLGGDEFVILLKDLGSDPALAARGAHLAAEKLRRALEQPFRLDEHPQHVSCCTGIALFPRDAGDGETLLRHADTAMYRAKSEGRNHIRFFEPAMQEAVAARHALEGQIWRALDEEQFALVYQPLFDPGGRVAGAEALIRWRHPERGWVAPGDFIPVAEDSGSIIGIGQWVIEQAVAQLRAWRADGRIGDDWHLAVNVSPRQFRQPDFVARVASACDAIGNGLILEITEGVLVRDTADTADKMVALRRLGVRFHIDDFGTGYSSMAYLKSLPVDGIKIDQSFVRDLETDPNDAAIIEAIVAVARRFRLALVAEGVEHEAQLDYLRARGCDYFQGFLLGRPVPPAEFTERFLGKPAPAAPALTHAGA